MLNGKRVCSEYKTITRREFSELPFSYKPKSEKNNVLNKKNLMKNECCLIIFLPTACKSYLTTVLTSRRRCSCK